jgi:hypothetical protein
MPNSAAQHMLGTASSVVAFCPGDSAAATGASAGHLMDPQQSPLAWTVFSFMAALETLYPVQGQAVGGCDEDR